MRCRRCAPGPVRAACGSRPYRVIVRRRGAPAGVVALAHQPNTECQAGGSAADAFTDVGELLAGVLDHMPHPFSHPSDHSVVVDVLTPMFMEALIHECTNPDRYRTSGNQEPGTGRKG